MLSLPGYSITAQIYESAYSLVYRGVRERDLQPLIFKVLKPNYPTPNELTRYRQEYEITRSLNLEGVVRVYGIETYHNTLVMFLEDFGGESLKYWLAERWRGAKPAQPARPNSARAQAIQRFRSAENSIEASLRVL